MDKPNHLTPMDSEFTNETQLTAEIDRLREQFPQTQDLYREVCALLFFRYGITPTANKLYQLVRKGSMSAPAEALTKFWTELREKSRTRIEHPDLPDTLRAATGEFAVAVWTAANSQANQLMAGYRQEADLAVTEAKNAQAVAVSRCVQTESEFEQIKKKLADREVRIGGLEQALAASQATASVLEKQYSQARLETTSLHERFETTKQQFSEQLERLRTGAAQSEERFQASEKRVLLEVDRERQATARLQKELENSRMEMALASERYRNEATTLQAQIGNLRQQLGSLEGKLHETVESKKELTKEVKELTSQAQELASHAVTLQAELQNWRTRAEKAEITMKLQSKDKVPKRSKKVSP